MTRTHASRLTLWPTRSRTVSSSSRRSATPTRHPTSPWKYASYPAALPHVLGVSAMNDTGGIPSFSNRDPIYNDLAAPGLEILSILPRPLTARFPSCSDQGYSSCGPDEFREAQGDVVRGPAGERGAAAVLLSLRPTLRPEQVTKILQSTAIDLDPETGCDACADGRDAYSGWGRLDVACGRRRARRSRSRVATSTSPTTISARVRYRVSRTEPPTAGASRLLGRPGRRLRDPSEPKPTGLRRSDRAPMRASI